MSLRRVAVINSAHGLMGHVFITSFVTNYSSLKDYSPLTDKKRVYSIIKIRLSGMRIIAKIKGVDSRNDAEKLRGIVLFAGESKFPVLNEGEFFHSELEGMRVVSNQGFEYGVIKGCYNFGAGDVVEITLRNSTKTILFPFDNDFFPFVSRKDKVVTLVLPEII